MDAKILQRQSKTRGGILEIMHEECRHGLKGFQFSGQHQLFRKPKVQQVCGNLIPNALEQIEFLDGVWKSVDAICKNRASEPASPRR